MGVCEKPRAQTGGIHEIMRRQSPGMAGGFLLPAGQRDWGMRGRRGACVGHLQSIFALERLCLRHKESRDCLELPGALGTPALPQLQFLGVVFEKLTPQHRNRCSFPISHPRLGISHALPRCASSSSHEAPAAHLIQINSASLQNPGALAAPDTGNQQSDCNN